MIASYEKEVSPLEVTKISEPSLLFLFLIIPLLPKLIMKSRQTY